MAWERRGRMGRAGRIGCEGDRRGHTGALGEVARGLRGCRRQLEADGTAEKMFKGICAVGKAARS